MKQDSSPILPAGLKPYYLDERSSIAIVHGDCREVLPQLGKADLRALKMAE